MGARIQPFVFPATEAYEGLIHHRRLNQATNRTPDRFSAGNPLCAAYLLQGNNLLFRKFYYGPHQMMTLCRHQS